MRNHFWLRPWGVLQNFCLFLGLWVVGIALEWITHTTHHPLSLTYPYNLTLIFLPLLFWGSWLFIPWMQIIIRWSQSHALSIVALTATASLFFLAALIPEASSLSRVRESWPWFFTLFLTLQTQFFLVIDRFKNLKKLNIKDISFILLHFGVLMTLLCVNAGEGDFLRVKVKLYPKVPLASGVDHFDRIVELPFLLELKKFQVEFYPPQLMVVEKDDATPALTIKRKIPLTLNSTFEEQGKIFTLQKYWPFAIPFAEKFYQLDQLGSAPVLFLSLKENTMTRTLTLTPGSQFSPAQSYSFPDQRHTLILETPRPKKFQSTIKYLLPSGEVSQVEIQVNHPLTLSGWKIYQYGYDETLGKWSSYTLLEAVYDPWWFAISTGLFIIFAGAILLLWSSAPPVADVGLPTTKRQWPLQKLDLLKYFYLATLACTIFWIGWKQARPPIKTLGETRLCYAFLLTLIGEIISKRYQSQWVSWVSLFLSFIFVSINFFHNSHFDQTLAPALQSFWFIPHVVSYILAYALLSLATLLAVKPKNTISDTMRAVHLVHAGMAFLTFGLLLGAMWAKSAWGHYWSWDPKECWALVTWMLYLFFIHSIHFQTKDAPQKDIRGITQWMLVINFFILLFCWFGISYLPFASRSLHSYGQ